MPISGLVLTLNREESNQDEALSMIKQSDQIMLGPISGQKVPAVLDTPNKDENKKSLRWLESLPGIHHIDVVYVSLEEDSDEVDKQSTFENKTEAGGDRL